MSRLRWQSRLEFQQPTWVRKILIIITFLILFSVLTLILIEYRISPVIYVWAEQQGINLGTQAISVAIEETLAAGIVATELTNLITDHQGSLQAIQYDTREINRIFAAATQSVQQSLADLSHIEFQLPIGQLTGLDFLAAWGPKLPCRFIPIGSVETTSISSFNAAGINQTWHRIYLEIKIKMRVAIPLIEHEFPVITRVPIVEEIIIGSVPSWYFAPGGTVGGFAEFNQPASEQSNIEFDLFNLGI